MPYILNVITEKLFRLFKEVSIYVIRLCSTSLPIEDSDSCVDTTAEEIADALTLGKTG